MPMTDLPQDHIRLQIGEASADFALHGGELMSWRIGGRELVWHGDPAHWSRRAPILFPVVGASVDGRVRVGGRSYPMPQHGFARDGAFSLEERTQTSLRLRLTETEASLAQYPFRFALDVVADLKPDGLSIAFLVTNRDQAAMPYAIGFHPAFPWPLDGTGREGHAVLFEAREETRVPEVAAGGLLDRTGRDLPFDGRHLPLEPSLFTEALVFLDARSRLFTFQAPSGAAIAMAMEDFPHLAVWSRPSAPFVSLEAWTGHADWAGFSGELAERASIRVLPPGATGRHAVTLSFQPPG